MKRVPLIYHKGTEDVYYVPDAATPEDAFEVICVVLYDQGKLDLTRSPESQLGVRWGYIYEKGEEGS